MDSAIIAMLLMAAFAVGVYIYSLFAEKHKNLGHKHIH